MLTAFDHALQHEARNEETEGGNTDQQGNAIDTGEKDYAGEADNCQHDAGAEIKADVAGFAKSGLNEPGAGAGDVGGRKWNRFAEGIQSLLDTLSDFNCRLFLRDGGVTAEGAQAGSQHGTGSYGGRAKGKDHQGNGDEDDDSENQWHDQT